MRDWPETVTPKWRIAVFLDRDGTINEDTDYPHLASELQLLPRALEGLRRLSRLPVHIIVVSNQAGIAKRLFTVEQMRSFNAELRRQVFASGGRIDAMYYCPHFEAKDLPEGHDVCACSKPRPGMLLEAATDFHLDLASSFMIGDKQSDVLAGQAAGVRSILLLTGKAGSDEPPLASQPEVSEPDLASAANWIAKELSRSYVTTGS